MIKEIAQINYLPDGESSLQLLGSVFQGYSIERKGDELSLRLIFSTGQSTEIQSFRFVLGLERSMHNMIRPALAHLGKRLICYTNQDNEKFIYCFDDGQEFSFSVINSQ